MTLHQIRAEAIDLATSLYGARQQLKQNHSLFSNEIVNAGKWKGQWEKKQGKGMTVQEGTLFAALLPLSFSPEEKNASLWPWQNRSAFDSDDKIMEWMNCLLQLDDQATIFVDVIPDLGIWICDIFNYIPRHIWNLATRLIARFYRSSKQLFSVIYNQDTVSVEQEEIDKKEIDKKEFFFYKIDKALEELFDFSKPVGKKGTTRSVFCNPPTEKDDEIYGEHSHVHRHGLYLLFQVALLDADWQSTIFDATKNSYKSHFERLTDESCLSVYYTSLLDVCYSNGHHSSIDGTLIQSFGIGDVQILSKMPQKTSTEPFLNWKPISEEIIRKKVLKKRALKSNIQLVMCFHQANKIHQAETDDNALQLQNDIQNWIGSHQVTATWSEIQYDYLGCWLNEFNKREHESILQERVQFLNNLSPSEKRKRMIECYLFFVGLSKYSLATRDERKQAFFDIWYLLSVPSIFEDSFGTHLLEAKEPLIFDTIDGFYQSILDFLKTHCSTKEIGGIEYTKWVILIAILVQSQKFECHIEELQQLIREGFLKKLFVLDGPKNQIFKDATMKQYSVSPLAAWLMNTSTFTSYRTPILFQIIQSFLMYCKNESQRLHLFWRLSIYELDGDIYKLFAKNLQFPFHLLKESPVQFTKINWLEMCSKLQILGKEQSQIIKMKEQDLVQIRAIFEKGKEIWSAFLQTNHRTFQLQHEPAWATNWDDIVLFWSEWAELENIETYLQYKEWQPRITSFFINIQDFVQKIPNDIDVQCIQNVIHQIKTICKHLEKGEEIEFVQVLQQIQENNPNYTRHKIPFELNLMYSSIMQKNQKFLNQIVHTERQFLEWDKEIQSVNITFKHLASYFTRHKEYWSHTQSVFESSRVEDFIAKAWLDNLDLTLEWTNERYKEVFVEYINVFEHYKDNIFKAYSSLMKQIIENPKMLGKYHVPLWINMMETIEQDGIQSKQTDIQKQKEDYKKKIMEYEERQFLEWDKEIQSVNITFKHLASYFTRHKEYWSHTQNVFEPSRVEDFIANAWLVRFDNVDNNQEWTNERYTAIFDEYIKVFDHYEENIFKAYSSLITQIVGNPKKLGQQYYPLLQNFLQYIEKNLQSQSERRELVKQDQNKQDYSQKIEALDKELRKKGMFVTARHIYQKYNPMSIRGKILRFSLNYCLTPFVSSVVSLTLLLDFGADLLHLYDYNSIASIVSILVSLVIAFGHPYFSKHYDIGVPPLQSIYNIVPSFGASVVFSILTTWIWSLANEGPTFGTSPIFLMTFFTIIVKAAYDGAFDTDN